MPEIKVFFSDLRGYLKRMSIPTLIIGAFWVLILVLGSIQGVPLATMLSDTIRRFGMWGLFVLAMVPSIQSGTGPNFALPIGVCCGLLSLVCAIEFGFMGIQWLLASAAMAIVLASVVGYFYGKLMNAVKGSEMTIATYTGFSITYLFSILWMALPFSSPRIGWMLGSGLRNTLELGQLGGAQIINNFLGFEIVRVVYPSGDAKTLWLTDLSKSNDILQGIGGSVSSRFTFPTGMLLLFAAFCLLMWLFFRSKTGIAISAAGLNPVFAKASGLNVDSGRVKANIISTVLAALGIIVYSQSYGYAQLYDAPLMMAFQAVAAVLIGGATAHRSKIIHVIIGTFLFQGLLTNGPPVLNSVFPDTDLSEIIRMVVQNGIILYALTQVKGGGE